MDIGILLLRSAVGLTLAAHGAQKLFGWFGGMGLDKTGQGLTALGFHPGRRHAVMAGLIEVGAGVLLAIGFLTPVAAALTASVMIVAAGSAHLRNGFFNHNGGYEFNLVLGVSGLSLAFIGAGALSIDALIGSAFAGTLVGIAAIIVAMAGAALQLAQRRNAVSPQMAKAA